MLRSTLLMCLCVTGVVRADVRVSSSVVHVAADGQGQLLGTLQFTVTGNDFRTADPAAPIYLYVRLDHNAFLSHTLVDEADPDPYLSSPVNLALKLEGDGTHAMAAAPNAVRIVRWVAGEPGFWLAVTQASTQWLTVDGTPVAPTTAQTVSWTLGPTARWSAAMHASDTSNLPFNTRAYTVLEGETELAVSTLLCVDLAHGHLADDGTLESQLSLDVAALHAGAALGDGTYSVAAASPAGIGFIMERANLGRGHERTCDLSVAPDGGSATAGGGGLAGYQQTLTADLSCASFGNTLPTRLHPGSVVTLTAVSAQAGFPLTDAAAFTNLDGVLVPDPDSLIQVNGVDLYQRVGLRTTGAAQALNPGATIGVSLTLWYDPALTQAEVAFHVDVAEHGSGADEAPYDGPEQQRRCGAAYYGPDAAAVTVLLPATRR